MDEQRLPLTDTLQKLPVEWPEDPLPSIRTALARAKEKVIVLDDDPTGTQTVHGVAVLTEWPVEALRAELANDLPATYLLTNSRSLPLDTAQAMNAEIGRNLAEAGRQANREFVVVSRSDSTLRGHFPGEVQALAEALRCDFDAWLIIPFFKEGGRYTIEDVHYVAEGDWLVPAGQTEFARDASFGYHASNLREWVAEKTGGQVPAGAVGSVSLDDIRTGGPEQVARRLRALPPGSVCVVNAAATRDVEVFTAGLLAAEAEGRRFLYRTAASFVPVRAGIMSRPLLKQSDLALPESGGGLIVVGSYVPRTTGQVAALLAQPDLARVEVRVEELLFPALRQQEIERVAEQASRYLADGRDVVVFTSRKLVVGDNAEASLSIGQQVSDALVAIVRSISIRPRYILAKGGITSSDVATRGLEVKRGMVLGQIIPGVPVWRLGPESRYPGLVYIVFPGNVGGPQAVADIVDAVKPAARE